MIKLTLADVLYYLVADNEKIEINTYNNCKPFRNTDEFRNSGDDILNHHVGCFGADNDVLYIQMDD